MNLHVNKTVLFSAIGVSVLGAGVWFFMRSKKKATPEAAQTNNTVADTQTTETVSNLVSSVVDTSLQLVGVGESRGIRNNNQIGRASCRERV